MLTENVLVLPSALDELLSESDSAPARAAVQSAAQDIQQIRDKVPSKIWEPANAVATALLQFADGPSDVDSLESLAATLQDLDDVVEPACEFSK